MVTVRRNRVELLATGVAFDAEPKTDAGKRSVAVPPHVLPVLAEHMATWAGPDRVFVGRDGGPMRGDAVRQAFDRARHRVGMPGFRFHDLRHSFASWYMMNGGDLYELAKILGVSLRTVHRDLAAMNEAFYGLEAPDWVVYSRPPFGGPQQVLK